MDKKKQKDFENLTELDKLIRVIRIYLEWLPIVFIFLLILYLHFADSFFNMVYARY